MISSNRSVWELFLKDSVSSKMNALNGLANKTSNGFANAQDRINQMQDKISGMSSELPGLSRGLELMNNPLVLAGAGLAAVGTGLYKATSLAFDYEESIAKINATAQLADEPLNRLKNRILDIGSASGGHFDEIPSAYEKILSITGKVNQSLDILETSVKGAKAGFSDIDVVGNAIARTMSTLGSKSPKANELLDTYMMAKNVGAGEFKDFSQYMPAIISSGSSVGYDHKQSVGLFTSLTKTFDSAEAAMLSQNIMTAFKKTDVIEGLKSKGVDVFENGFRRPINEVLKDIGKLRQKMSPEQFTYFMDDVNLKDAQAVTGIAALTGNLENVKTVFDGIAKSAGEADRQMEKSKNRARDWGDISDKIKGWGVSIGDQLLPVVDKLVTTLDKSAKGWSIFFNHNVYDTLRGIAPADSDKIAQQQQHITSSNMANDAFEKRFGFSFLKNDRAVTAGESAYYYKYYNHLMDVLSNKNKIVPESSASNIQIGGNESDTSKGGESSLSKKLQPGIDNISSGGKNVRNVTVSINKLVESLVIKASTVTESSLELENKVKEIMLRAVQGSEIALSNG